VPVRNARLHYREIGQGPPLIVLHGGPVSYAYLLPELVSRLTTAGASPEEIGCR